MSRGFLLITLTLGIVFNSMSTNEEALGRFEAANEMYEAANYNEAIQAYEDLLSSGYTSDELHYNLGNAYFKNNQIAHSILHYEKALKINPANEDAAYNLSIANEKTIDKVEAVPELFIYRWWRSMVNLFGLNQWATLTILLLSISLLGLIAYLFTENLLLRKSGFYFSIAFIALALISWFMAYKQSRYLQKVQHAIIMDPTVNINSSPSAGSSKLFVLHEGTKVRIKDQKEGWYKVSLPNGNEGWIKKEFVEGV